MSSPPRPMDCREALERLYEYLDRELTPELAAEVQRHLEACAHCFPRFQFERAFLQFLEARARGQGATPELKRRILQQLFGGEQP